MSKSNKKYIEEEDVKIKDNRKALNKKERKEIKQRLSEEDYAYIEECELSGLFRG
tara:strand:+ start:751 stop:915 length:165 start_codon:yes stop_codon:yes gene_type:complete